MRLEYLSPCASMLQMEPISLACPANLTRACSAQEPILALQRQLTLLLDAPADAAASRLTLAKLAASSGHHQVLPLCSCSCIVLDSAFAGCLSSADSRDAWAGTLPVLVAWDLQATNAMLCRQP